MRLYQDVPAVLEHFLRLSDSQIPALGAFVLDSLQLAQA
jgi:hypothetical protein